MTFSCSCNLLTTSPLKMLQSYNPNSTYLGASPIEFKQNLWIGMVAIVLQHRNWHWDFGRAKGNSLCYSTAIFNIHRQTHTHSYVERESIKVVQWNSTAPSYFCFFPFFQADLWPLATFSAMVKTSQLAAWWPPEEGVKINNPEDVFNE